MQSHTAPDQYLSAVSDTMAQNHMLLPWLGKLAQPKVCLQVIRQIIWKIISFLEYFKKYKIF